MNSLEILYKAYSNYWHYPISKSTYFKRTYGHSDYTSYELVYGDLSFYATNDQLFPLHIYTNSTEEHYIASVQFGTALNPDKSVYNKETGERFDLHFSEYTDFSTNEVICTKNRIRLFHLSENTFTFSHPKLILKGTVEGHELELFVSFLCFFIKYDEEFYG